MAYLSKEIERLLKQKKVESLIRKQYSCGIFQEYEQINQKPDRLSPSSE